MLYLYVVPRTVVFLAREVYAVRLHRTLKTRIKLKNTLLTICERDMSPGYRRLYVVLLLSNKITE